MRLKTIDFGLLLAPNEYASDSIRAVRYTRYGPASALSYEVVEKPVPRAGAVLVRMRAAGVNPIDPKLSSGRCGQPARAGHSGWTAMPPTSSASPTSRPPRQLHVETRHTRGKFVLVTETEAE